MRLVKVKQDFYDLCIKNNVGSELLHNESGRPCVLILKLKYKGKKRHFVVPIRSNISNKTPSWQYLSLPPNKNTKSGNIHGIHYIKLFPIDIQYVSTYLTNGNNFLILVKNVIDKHEKEIITACQDYLYEVEHGNKHNMTPDIDGIIRILGI